MSEPTMTDGIQKLGTLVRVLDGEIDDDGDAAGRDRLVRTVAARRRGPRGVGTFAALAAAAVALAAALVLVWPRSSLRYDVRGAALSDGGYVRAADAATVVFSDGSEITLDEGTTARVAEVTADGARLLLEDGRARVAVVHKDGARWVVSAGPFEVTVTGTHFEVGWAAPKQRLDLTLTEGSVVVRGPLLGDGIAMVAGQRLSAELERSVVELGLVTEPVAAATAEQPPAPTAEETAAAPPPAPPPPAVAKSWAQRIAEGDAEGVLAEAESRGIDAVLASGTLDELVALADAARYKGRSDVARGALEKVRERYPASKPARTAAFLLGRMAAGASALRWYDVYLAEAPNGTFAAEAVGRKLVILRASNPAQARALAEEYLARWPKGPYAAVAREIAP
jgi:hypothetical protein